MKLHHIAWATSSIPDAISELSQIVTVQEEQPYAMDTNQDNALLKMVNVDGVTIEFVDGKISTRYQNGNNLYHLCFESEDYECDIQKIKDLGWIAISESKPAALFGNKRVSFFMKPGFPMIEVKES